MESVTLRYRNPMAFLVNYYTQSFIGLLVMESFLGNLWSLFNDL